MNRKLLAFVIFLSAFQLTLWSFSQQVFAQSKTNNIAALIIYNANYQNIEKLPNVLDQSVMQLKQTLEKKGIEVSYYQALTKAAIFNAIDAFSYKAENGKYKALLVYYIGATLQFQNKNFILPIDFRPPTRNKDLLYRAFSLDKLLSAFNHYYVPQYFFINGENQQKFGVGNTLIGKGDLQPAKNSKVIYAYNKYWRRAPFFISRFVQGIKQKSCFEAAITYSLSEALENRYHLLSSGKVTTNVCWQNQPGKRVINKRQIVKNLQDKALKLILHSSDASTYAKALSTIQQAMKLAPNNKTSRLIAAALDPARYGLVLVKGGVFTMGNALGRIQEKPIHKVKMSDFYIGKYEVTNLAYLIFITRYNGRRKRISDVKSNETYKRELLISDHYLGLAYFQQKKLWGVSDTSRLFHPVVNITWYGALKYCEYYGLKLPSEAQWEYAAKTTRPATFAGSNKLVDVGWFIGNTPKNTQTQQVGSLKPNSWGIYDLSGNVYEWCLDTYERDYYQLLAKNRMSINPVNLKRKKVIGIRTPSDPYPKVIRGGSYQSSYLSCKVFSRNGEYPFEVSDQPFGKEKYLKRKIGFRVTK